jgi:hypothetical protein
LKPDLPSDETADPEKEKVDDRQPDRDYENEKCALRNALKGEFGGTTVPDPA